MIGNSCTVLLCPGAVRFNKSDERKNSPVSIAEVTIIRESEVVVSVPKQASTLMFDVWFLNLEFF